MTRAWDFQARVPGNLASRNPSHGPSPSRPQICARMNAESSASLYTGAESDLGDGVLGEVEKDNFITLPGKGGHSGLRPRKTVCPPNFLNSLSGRLIISVALFFQGFSLALSIESSSSAFSFYLTFSVSMNLGLTVIYYLEGVFLCRSMPV